MLAELHSCPSLFATTADLCSVMAKMNEHADKLVMCVAAPSGECYQDEFDEAGLSKVKALLGEKSSWMFFFCALRESFNRNCVTVQKVTENVVDVVCRIIGGREMKEVKSDVLLFHVGKVDTDLLPMIVNGIVHTYQMHVHPKSKEQEADKMAEEVAQLKITAEQLEKEIRVLKESDSRKRHIDSHNIQRKEQLNKKIAEAERKSKKLNGRVAGHSTNSLNSVENNVVAPITKGRIRQPLGNEECKPYDVDLLRLIKSRWMTKDDLTTKNLSRHVIIPFTQSELKKRTISFVNKQQETIWKALDKIDMWDYNVFEIQECMGGDDFASLSTQPNGGSFFITMYALLIKYDFLSRFNIDEQIALNWISNVEAGYYGNPYHNSMHAADVLHITHYILGRGGLKERCKLSDVQVFAALFAAAIHDYGHPGVNNNFHVKTQSYSAIVYNDRSVLENLHLSSVFELMKNPRLNILESFSEDQRREIRDTVIEMVLATDMGQHEKYLEKFRKRLAEHVSFTERENQELALSIALKMADISNCARPLEIYLKWSAKVSDEFYLQGDRERNMGLQCSPFMNRLEPSLAKGQISFMNYIIIPFFEAVASFLPNMTFTLNCADVCRSYWT